MEQEQEQELRVALFGLSGTGKTTFLSSYYGNLQRGSFGENHGWQLRAKSLAEEQTLLNGYYGLEAGNFPRGTKDFSSYSFGFEMKDDETGEYRPSEFSITWYDYPGEWWTTDHEDAQDYSRRVRAFRELLNCHAAILLVDAQQFLRDGPASISHLFDTFRNGIQRIRQSIPNLKFPKTWVIALSKADLLPQDYTAERFWNNVRQNAFEQLVALRKTLDSASFGNSFLLLSSVRGSNNRVVDAHSFLGMELIAPLTLKSILQTEAQRMKSEAPKQGFIDRVWDPISEAIDFILPRLIADNAKLGGIALALKAAADHIVGAKVEERKKEIAHAIKKGKILQAAIDSMNLEFDQAPARIRYLYGSSQ